MPNRRVAFIPIVLCTLLCAPAPTAAQNAGANVALKKLAVQAVEAQSAQLIGLSDQVWRFAETALKETQSSKVLADHAEKEGFRVTRGVAGLPTAFVAEFGQGSPVIGIMGEYDALPGLSQKAQPTRAALEEGAAGHGCGHNLFGAASLGAAIAIKRLIADGALKGTIKFFGTPAEERYGGKVYMAREGVFKGVDVMLAWHPETKTRADTSSSQALVDLAIEFKGRAAHAAADPWNGRSAADGAEAFTFGINLLREHVKPTVRMHYVVQNAGEVPNVVPEHARVWLWVRDRTFEGVETVLERVRQIAQGAALVAGVESTIINQGGDYEILVNTAGAKLLDSNLRWLGPITYTDAEQTFARELQKAAGVPAKGVDATVQPLEGQELEGGSTDVGDVSWLVPTLHVSVTTAPVDVPWHAWPVVASGGMSIGHKGMVHAAKTLAATMVDLFDDAAAREAVRTEFAKKTEGFTYKAYIPDGPPVVK
jgi:aminobenzoyl-glutamate utilization protein B